MSYFLTNGTKLIIDGETQQARHNATTAIFFEQMRAIRFQKTQASANHSKLEEIFHCDEHTLVKYLRKRIPCKCLDEKYKEVKSITKMGFCCNQRCSLPDRKVERKGMLHCIRCRQVYYCSRECQKTDWPIHKKWCGEFVERQAAFEANLKDAK